ncbi:Formyltransferase [Rhizoctonia solani]|uniref:methionyl-tRNA formyltransferase n=1 Tax=Rhizoctonia solani TaxID=456999 RepID=A0A8H7M916_9AGAM|nr:Formyltransferase [Rhizoctonia solani]
MRRLFAPSKYKITQTFHRDYNVLFFGRDTFSSVVFSELSQAKDVLDLLVVATTPDQWIGRRRQTLSVVTASFGRRIPSSCLDIFHRGRKLNVHPSLLPKYRGAAPIQHALLDGVDTTGVSVIEMEDGKGFDFGDIWGQRTMDIPMGSTYMSLEPKLAKMGGQLLVEILRKAKSDSLFTAYSQDHSRATKARLIRAEQSEIDWKAWNAERIERTHRAIGHQRPVFTYIPDKHTSRLQLLEMRTAAESDTKVELNVPGKALFYPSDNTLRIGCAEGTQLIVSKLKTENKSALKAKEWWNGVPPIWLQNGFLQLGSPCSTNTPDKG